MNKRLATALVMAVLLGAAVTMGAGPTTAPVNLDPATAARGRALRSVLLDAMEQAYDAGGTWPEKVAGDGAQRLVYSRPTSNPDRTDERRARQVAAATIVLHETLQHNPDGVWVGYADGHLEFARDAVAMADCAEQARIANDAPKAAPDIPEKQATGRLTLHVIDPAGKPVKGARVGNFLRFGDLYPPDPDGPNFVSEKTPTLTDAQGNATLDAAAVFDAKFDIQQASPLYVYDWGRELAARLDVDRSEFSATPKVHEVRLAPACRVNGLTTAVDFPNGTPAMRFQAALAFTPGNERMYTVQSLSDGPWFTFLLPPGDYGINAYGSAPGVSSTSAYRFVHIEPGRGKIDLQIDLPPNTLARLIGRPAPELIDIKGWKNSAPLKLASLRGKAVVLDFWGYWCNPCCEAMPGLMKLWDDFHEKGLVIIAIHDDSVDSIAAMEAKLSTIRQNKWAGRDLPFPVALDGGGPTRIRYSATTEKGKTTAAYGVTSFPTTILIAPDGKVVGTFDAESEDARKELAAMLSTASK